MLEGLTPPKKEQLCKMMSRAASLSKEDLAVFLDALASPIWSGAALSAALTERGFPVNRDSINQHRAKTCSCAK